MDVKSVEIIFWTVQMSSFLVRRKLRVVLFVRTIGLRVSKYVCTMQRTVVKQEISQHITVAHLYRITVLARIPKTSKPIMTFVPSYTAGQDTYHVC